MINSKGNSIKYLITLLLVVFITVGCIPKEFTPAEKVIFTTTKSLQAASEVRVTALTTIARLYKDGVLTDEAFKQRVIELGDELQIIINVTANTMLIYKDSGLEKDKRALAEKIDIYVAVYGKFSDLVMPYILEKLDDGGTK